MTSQYDNKKIIPMAFDAGTPGSATVAAILRTLPDKTGKAGKVLKVSANEEGCEWGDGPDTKAVWGQITGTLSAQTDLDTALSGKQKTIVASTLTLAAADWSESTQTIQVTGVTAAGTVLAIPAKFADWVAAGIYLSAKGDGTLTFTCGETVPASDIDVTVIIL